MGSTLLISMIAMRPGLLPLLLGAAGLLAASYASWSLLGGESAGRRAFAHWLPIAAAAACLGFLELPEMAVALVIGSSVAILAMVGGFVAMAAPMDEVPPGHQAVWMLAPVPVILALMGGMRGFMDWTGAVVLLAEGGALLWLWWTTDDEGRRDWVSAAAGPKSARLGLASAAVVIALAAVSAWAAGLGTMVFHREEIRFSVAAITGSLLSIALTMPMISTATAPVHRGEVSRAISGNLGTALLNTCFGLPLALAAFSLRHWARPFPRHRGQVSYWLASRHLKDFIGQNLTYAGIWRIDLIALLVLSILSIPLALGYLRLDRRTATVLIVGYCLYLLAFLISSSMAG